MSLTGTWMQGVAQAWLVLQLTGSGTALGLVIAVQFLPVLLLAPMGGVLADRLSKRRIMVACQTTAGLLALVLGLLVAAGAVELWMVYALAGGLGVVTAIELPSRQTFVLEMVGPERLTNAVSLSSVMLNLARIVGPAVAGVLIATVALELCFFLNAGSYVATVLSVVVMRSAELLPAPRQPRARGQLREGVRYVRSSPELLVPLLMMAVIGTLAFEFQVILPLVARYSFDGDAGTYGAMSSIMGVGAVAGGLVVASRSRRSAVGLAKVAIVFGAAILAAAAAPTLAIELAVLVVVGATSISFLSLGNTALQLAAAPEMRGRVMALWSVAFLGSTPVGGPIVGWVGEHAGPRWGLALGGTATLLAGLLAYRTLATIDGRAPGVAPTEPGVTPATLTV